MIEFIVSEWVPVTLVALVALFTALGFILADD